MAVPLAGAGWTASIDDVRSLVLAIHMRINVDHPRDDYFLNLLGTGLLAGRLPKRLAHLKGRVVILNCMWKRWRISRRTAKKSSRHSPRRLAKSSDAECVTA